MNNKLSLTKLWIDVIFLCSKLIQITIATELKIKLKKLNTYLNYTQHNVKYDFLHSFIIFS